MSEHRDPNEQLASDIHGVSELAEYTDLANNARAGYSVLQDLRPFGVTPSLSEMYELSHPLAEEGRGFFSSANASRLGALGIGLSAVDTLEYGADVVGDLREHGTEAFNRRETWNHIGETGVAAANTVLPFIPGAQPIAFGVSTAAATTDLAGRGAQLAFGNEARFTAGTAVGGVLDRMFGNDTLGDEVVRARGLRPDSPEAQATRMMMNQSPGALAYAVGRGVYDEGAAIVDGIANGRGAVGGALNTAGRAVGDAAVGTGRWVGNAAVSTGRAVGDAAAATGRIVGSAAIGTANAIGTGAAAVGSGAMAAGRGVGSAARSLWNW